MTYLRMFWSLKLALRAFSGLPSTPGELSPGRRRSPSEAAVTLQSSFRGHRAPEPRNPLGYRAKAGEIGCKSLFGSKTVENAL